MILRALADLESPREKIRSEAELFLMSPEIDWLESRRFWCQAGGVGRVRLEALRDGKYERAATIREANLDLAEDIMVAASEVLNEAVARLKGRVIESP